MATTQQAAVYTGILTIVFRDTTEDPRVETRVHHVTAINHEIAAFRMGQKAAELHPSDHVSLILFKGEHYDCMPQQEGG